MPFVHAVDPSMSVTTVAPTVALIYAHPSAERSLANRELLTAIEGLDFVDRCTLYDLYPDFDIDADGERRRLEAVDLIVIQHPIYWYSMPALLKLWFDEVFAHGWAYGDGGTALAGKQLQWVVTTGADLRAYAPDGPHGHPFDVFAASMRQTALFCGMQWAEPIVVHDAHADQAQVRSAGERYRRLLVDFHGRHPRASGRRLRSVASEDAATARPVVEQAAVAAASIASITDAS